MENGWAWRWGKMFNSSNYHRVSSHYCLVKNRNPTHLVSLFGGEKHHPMEWILWFIHEVREFFPPWTPEIGRDGDFSEAIFRGVRRNGGVQKLQRNPCAVHGLDFGASEMAISIGQWWISIWDSKTNYKAFKVCYPISSNSTYPAEVHLLRLKPTHTHH